MNKRAVELSINFIVMFILAMAMFAAGITIARRIFDEADVMKKKLSEQQKEQLEKILAQGDRIQTMFVTKKLVPGDNDNFGLGIRNDLGSEADFYVETSCDQVVALGGTRICEDGTFQECQRDMDEYIYIAEHTHPADDFKAGPFTIKNNDVEVFDVYVLVPSDALKGTYVFNVKVCEGDWCTAGNQYGVTKKLNVIVQ
jgi:hypothetical protein